MDEHAYLASLQVECRIARVAATDRLDRICELFARTTQFNINGRKLPLTELQALIAAPQARVFAIEVADRFGDHGLVGAAVIDAGEIVGLVMSCRVLGLGVEHELMRHIIASARDEAGPDGDGSVLSGEIVETPRNIPVRHIFRDHGFGRDADGRWRLRLDQAPATTDRAVA